jgi:hypothetical protein
MGWSDEAYTRYVEVCKRIKKQRGTKTSKGLEKASKTCAHDVYANGRVVSHINMSKERQREIFDELDIE